MHFHRPVCLSPSVGILQWHAACSLWAWPSLYQQVSNICALLKLSAQCDSDRAFHFCCCFIFSLERLNGPLGLWLPKQQNNCPHLALSIPMRHNNVRLPMNFVFVWLKVPSGKSHKLVEEGWRRGWTESFGPITFLKTEMFFLRFYGKHRLLSWSLMFLYKFGFNRFQYSPNQIHPWKKP